MTKPIQLFVIAVFVCITVIPAFAQSELAELELQPVRWEGNQVVYQMKIPSGVSQETTKSLIADLSSRKGIEWESYNEKSGRIRFAASNSLELSVFSDLDKNLPGPQPSDYFLEGSSPKVYDYVSEDVPSHIIARIKLIKVMSTTRYQSLNEIDRMFIDENEERYFVSSKMTLGEAYQELIKELLTK